MKKIAALILALIAFSIVQPTAAYAGGQIDGGDIQNGTITGADIDNGTLTGVDVRNGTIGNADLANGSVSSAKLGNGSVTTRAIATGQVASDEILDGSVTLADLRSDTISEIVNRAHTTDVGATSEGSLNSVPAWSGLFSGQSGAFVTIVTVTTATPARASLNGVSCITVQFGDTATCQLIAQSSSSMATWSVENADGSPYNQQVDAEAFAIHLQ